MRASAKLLTILMVLGLALGIFAPAQPAYASAYTASWVVSVTYQNVGTATAEISVDFYEESSGTAMTFAPADLAAGAGTSFFIGSIDTTPDLPSSFRGSAVLRSTEPLVSTVVQFVQNDTSFKMRLLSNGFQTTDASDQFMIPTVLLNKFTRTTIFSIQNTENSSVEATIKFYDADAGGALASTITHVIPAQSGKYIDMGVTADTGLPGTTTVFNGSAIITAELEGTSTPANVVAAASEYYTDRNVGANFEGVPLARAANTVYMATGLCQKFGLDTFYAVQNASLTDDASITVSYKNTNGTSKTTDGPYVIGPGQKKSINTCAPSTGANMADFTGSATITSVGEPIVVVGKAQNSLLAGGPSTQDVFTAFLGEPAGTSKRALPFIRFANDTNYNDPANVGGKQRGYIAVQSLTAGSNQFDVKYYDKSGNLVETHTLTIAQFAKGNSDASSAGALGQFGMNAGEFGYYTDGSFGGAVIVEANPANPSATFIAIVRSQHPGAGEDYNAVPVN